MDSTNLDDLELELRKLPGVRAAGFTDAEDLLHVQVQVAGDQPSPTLPQQAARIAHRYAEKPVAIEVVRWRTIPAAPGSPEAPVLPGPDAAVTNAVGTTTASDAPGSADLPEPNRPRVRLLAVLTFPDTDELEVHLTYSGRRIIGRALASEGIAGAINATLFGLRNFVPDLAIDMVWSEELTEHSTDATTVVACEVTIDGEARQGIAAGGSRIEAAARAALHALNRSLEHRTALPA